MQHNKHIIKNFDKILDRDIYKTKILDFLSNFHKNYNNLTIQRGIYLYGESGIGKTKLVCNLLKENNYDVIYYDSSDIRNKNIIEHITNDNMSNINVHSMFLKKKKKIVIVMDDIDCMNNGDKGGINSLIKIIRPKKTKKQKTEEISMNPIICIGNNQVDKKIKELLNVCYTLELNQPTNKHIESLLKQDLESNKYDINKLISFIDNDLRRFNLIINVIKNNDVSYDTLKGIFTKHNATENVKENVKALLNNNYDIIKHSTINETDRTIIGLLWHENIIDIIDKVGPNIDLYESILNNICFSDYIDRITFQKQIWEFNEMSSIIKTIYNNFLLNEYTNSLLEKQPIVTDVRFTKVLTKYSTEYNNMMFMNTMCQNMQMDKNDLFNYFIYLREKYSILEICELLEVHNINKLDINRMYKYLNIVKLGIRNDDENILI